MRSYVRYNRALARQYGRWMVRISTGTVNISADLEPQADQSPSTPREVSSTTATPAKPDQTMGNEEVFGTVSLTSDPVGADVYVDDALVGKTPTTLKLKPGQHFLRLFMQHYENWSQQITVSADSEKAVDVELKRST